MSARSKLIVLKALNQNCKEDNYPDFLTKKPKITSPKNHTEDDNQENETPEKTTNLRCSPQEGDDPIESPAPDLVGINLDLDLLEDDNYGFTSESICETFEVLEDGELYAVSNQSQTCPKDSVLPNNSDTTTTENEANAFSRHISEGALDNINRLFFGDYSRDATSSPYSSGHNSEENDDHEKNDSDFVPEEIGSEESELEDIIEQIEEQNTSSEIIAETETWKGRPKKGRKNKYLGQTFATRKKMRDLNKKHYNVKGKLVHSKKFVNYLCKCQKKCHEKVSEETRMNLFLKFWALGSYDS
ncbi:uncharacterized protein LOC126745792 isoform X2 [Anthonomus grandis grandis]|uniref:uncharacterized protein LOC126745792 isoform X2 n=1 Tax=Anthonomus grandis grandis TaxID=2921223 RepID=UPI0021665149|nr:uncharacterized protein LOC126745792 isoform X2 [Anthonomus grandis grandis]